MKLPKGYRLVTVLEMKNNEYPTDCDVFFRDGNDYFKSESDFGWEWFDISFYIPKTYKFKSAKHKDESAKPESKNVTLAWAYKNKQTNELRFVSFYETRESMRLYCDKDETVVRVEIRERKSK